MPDTIEVSGHTVQPYTDVNLEEFQGHTLAELLEAVQDEYGFDNVEDVQTSDAWQSLVDFHIGPAPSEQVAEQRALANLLVRREPIEREGYFIDHVDFDDQPRIGGRVLFGDGTTGTFGADVPELPTMATVVVEPFMRETNILTGEVEEYSTLERSEMDVRAEDHSLPVPDLTLTEDLLRLQGQSLVNGEAMVDPDNLTQRGTIYGDGNYPQVYTVTVGEEQDDVDWTAPDVDVSFAPRLRIMTEDSDDNRVRFKLPIDQTQETFDLSDEANGNRYYKVLSGKRLLIGARLGTTSSRNGGEGFNNLADEFGERAVVRALEALEEQGLLTEAGSTTLDDGTEHTYRALDLLATFEDGDGEVPEDVDGLDIGDLEFDDLSITIENIFGNLRFFDIEEVEPDTGPGFDPSCWEFTVHMKDQNGVFWADVREHPYSYEAEARDDEGNIITDENGEPVMETVHDINNQGAFVVFLSEHGVVTEDNAFSDFGGLGDVDEVSEDDFTEQAEADGIATGSGL
jgi:hypothetical protein